MKNVVLIVSILICFYSCKKTDNPSVVSKNSSAYLPMAIGNYWVYQEYQIKYDGSEYSTDNFDSVYISKDTIINGKSYYQFVSMINNNISHLSPAGCYRDSSGYLLGYSWPKDYVLFSDNNFTDTLQKEEIFDSFNDTLVIAATIFIKMEMLEKSINVPAGIFSVLNAKQTVNENPRYSSIVRKYNNRYYTQNVGLILFSNSFINDSSQIEFKLIRYNIKK